ncbi:MAG: GTP 3',8-cyclase MoaA [Bacillota bacterium]|jgi:cyclic pyranopterin phosphate synthase
MKDILGREINYLRISITDRCNLRCKYCMPVPIEKVEMAEILTFDEIVEVCRMAAELGIRYIKITGGEPLVRKRCVMLIEMIKNIPGIEKVTMTTNGVLLAENIDALKAAGLDAVNISLDTRNPEKFHEITGSDDYNKVIAGIEAAVNAGLRVKVNSVLMAGSNDSEWHDLVLLAKEYPVDVRFIEMMPIGYGKESKGVSNDDVKNLLASEYELIKDNTRHGYGPAEYYNIDGFLGSVGFISAMHGKFCKDCNRIRLTSTGFLKPCLCYGEGADLKELLRSGDLAKAKKVLRQVIENKPKEHCFENEKNITENHNMVGIGG